MRILYSRISSVNQNSSRQLTKQKEYDLTIEDRCSGSIAFFERDGGKQILKYINAGKLKSLSVHTIDRLGRNLRDIINTIFFISTEHKIPIFFINQSLRTIDEDGNENPISKLMISILATVSEMERNQIRERQMEGVALAKEQGLFKGRKKGTTEDTLKFLSKPQNKKALALLKEGKFNATQIGKIVGIHLNTVTKIKKVGLI
jgi:DNA invertase Pin-like site-specific DNA recombinase